MENEWNQKDFENLYSRQIGTYGMETSQKLLKLKIFIQGMRGIGFEIAKNLILAGPAEVTIRDNQVVEMNNLATNFYLKESHVGRISRGKAIFKELQKLNLNTNVNYTNKSLDIELVSNYNIVIITDYLNQNKILELNNYCRSQNPPIGFVLCGNLGLYTYSFIDFGNKHIINDSNGENCEINWITSITNDEEGLVITNKRHNLNDDDWVIFKEVKGMEEINDKKFKIKTKTPYSFFIGDTSKFNNYDRDGVCEQIKVPKEIKFHSLTDVLNDHKIVGDLINPDADFDHFDRPQDLFFIFKILIKFYSCNGRFPGLNLDDKVKLYDSIFKDKIDINNKQKILIECISKFSDCEFAPLVSFIGGIISQEIVKKTGKFTPINQLLFYDLYDKLPVTKEVNYETNEEKNGYIIKLFGKDFYTKVSKIRTFIVGTGALGCEYLKLFSLLGFSTEENSCIYTTDDDFIEVSNLNRQFLFRRKNVGSSKSLISSQSIKNFNHKINIKPFTLKVCEENEKIFTDNFFESLDFVVNAVDNVKARKYIDKKCILHNKYLFESGTLGTKCNSQIIIPLKTESYSDSDDPEEKSIPLCTLKLYPYLLDHTIEWARDFFQSFISDLSINLEEFIKNKSTYLVKINNDFKKENNLNELKEKLTNLNEIVKLVLTPKMEVIVKYIRQLFENIFNNQIQELIYNIPLDHLDEKGKPFWSSPKRPPQVIKFDTNDDLHSGFILSFYIIIKEIIDNKKEYIISKEEEKKILNSAKNCKIKNYIPLKKEISKNNEIKNNNQDDKSIISNLIKELSNIDFNSNTLTINIIEFEKDNDNNGHIDLITSISNWRARNYKISEGTRFDIKIIAGKILPAIASTTAMVVGAVGIEIVKKILDVDISKFRNLFANLAISTILFSEPLPPLIRKDKEYCEIILGPVITFPKNWDTWTLLKISNCTKVQDILDRIKKDYKVNVTTLMFSSNEKLIYEDGNKLYENTKEDNIIDHYIKNFPNFYYSKKKYLKLEIFGENKKNEDLYIAPIVLELFK